MESQKHLHLMANVGDRIRFQRKHRSLSQRVLAEEIGISAPYLNLIEKGHRVPGSQILDAIAQKLGINEGLLTGDLFVDSGSHDKPDGRIIDRQIVNALDQHPQLVASFIGARSLAEEYRVRLDYLENRLSHDAKMSETLFETLSAASALRSTVAILSDEKDLETDWRDRFEVNLRMESQRLSANLTSLADALDGTPSSPLQTRYQLILNHLTSANTAIDHQDVAAFGQYIQDIKSALTGEDDVYNLDADRARAPQILVFRRYFQSQENGKRLAVCDARGRVVALLEPQSSQISLKHFNCILSPVFKALANPDTLISERLYIRGLNNLPFDVCAAGASLSSDSSENTPYYSVIAMIPSDNDTPNREIGLHCDGCRLRDCSARGL